MKRAKSIRRKETPTRWKVGERVKHATVLEWGFGEVTALREADTVEVRFRKGGLRNIRADRLIRLTEAEIAEALPRARGGRPRPQRPHVSLETYKAAFVKKFPGGFRDPEYVKQERVYKVKASKALHEHLSAKALSGLVKKRNFAEVATRARRLVSATNLVFKFEQIKLSNGLKTPENQELFAKALLAQLYGRGPFQARMEGFMDALSSIGAAKWTIATYFAFLAFPKEHLFLKPSPTKRMARACSIELNYRPELNWLTYSMALNVASALKSHLRELRPKDMIDIQSFIWKVNRWLKDTDPENVP